MRSVAKSSLRLSGLAMVLGLLGGIYPGAPAFAAPTRLAQAKSPATVGCTYLKNLFAATDPSVTDSTVNLAAPGSNAFVYAVFQAAAGHAERAENVNSLEAVKCAASTVKVQPGTVSAANPPSVYSKFKSDKKGRLSDFVVNGQSLKGRLLGGSTQQGTALGVTFKLAAAYQSISSGGNLTVVLGVTGAPDGQRTLQASQATYQVPGGQTVQQSGTVGTLGSLQQGVSTTLAITFPSQPIGGTVTIPVESADFSQTIPVTIAIK